MEGSALEQDHRNAERRQRAPRHLRFPQRLDARLGGVAARGREDRCDAWAAAFCPSSRKARLPISCSARAAAIRPFQSPSPNACGIAQRTDEQPGAAHAACSHRVSTSSTALSVSG